MGRRQRVEVRSQKLQNVGSRLHVLESVWCFGFPLLRRTGGMRKIFESTVNFLHSGLSYCFFNGNMLTVLQLDSSVLCLYF